MSERQGREERAADTRRALIGAARDLFVEHGYFATGTEEIVAAAGVGTRGALYHHFTDKRALFLAVLHEVQAGLGAAVSERTNGDDPLRRLAASLGAFLDYAAERGDVQQILLIDGPAVLGWEEWRSIEASYGISAIEQTLKSAVDAGVIADQPLKPLAHLILALTDEAALFIANSKTPALARSEVGITIERLLNGLRQ